MEDFIKKIDLQNVSQQNLAFVGDAIYNVYIRTYLISISNTNTGKLHNKSIMYVSAKAQSNIVDKIYDSLDEEEKLVYKRGRNTNINTVSKHVDVVSYKKATGYEALLGYLYLKNDISRLEEIIKASIEIVKENTNK